ncbi:restriction endonuclease [Ideonella azotifigens]|uniref:ABC-three component systems C-terminal domain-containing protein n=1 Tax=Ideonella azotifigens TaxID=513160 RepID=A0ABN1JKD1_9BURK|nr:ABC-three component system protein [Ideonella azotifigens]MCD2341855.1 restriction endonuclease [Ideonella azotifigens]
MKYVYEDLSDDQFEQLVVLICQRLLGMGVQSFAKGVDGGRDAKFIGVAELIPSKAAPWNGTIIVQAKHTNGYNRSCSESDFFSTKSGDTVIGKEIPRIKKLQRANQLDHYILFANRSLTGNAESDIRAHIAKECGIPEQSIMLCGLEALELWLKSFPEIPNLARLDPLDSPLVVSPDELAEVVEALARHMDGAVTTMDAPPSPRTSYETKNALNKMSPEYAKTLRRQYLKDTAQVKEFLAAPENDELLRMYESTVDEFQLKIIAKRKSYQSFDDVMNYLMDLLFARDPILRRNKKLTRVMLFYMYWNCDIGEGEDAAPN